MAQYGWNFRATSGFVSDSAPDTYGLTTGGGESYPVTRNGITFGDASDNVGFGDLDSRDRSTGVDSRFAGLIFGNIPGNDGIFRIDLPNTGAWRIRLSAGDFSNTQTIWLQLKDTSTLITTINASTSAPNKYLDATGVERSSPSDWISNNAYLDYTFTTTILNIVFGDGLTKQGYLTHLDIESLGGYDFTFINPWMIA